MSTYDASIRETADEYDPSIDPPTTLEEVIEYSVWRDDQLTWGEETIANLVYLEADMGSDRHAIYDLVMGSDSRIEGQFSQAPWNGSVRS